MHTYIDLCCKDQYSEIIDIGCAEGYYAIGLSLRNLKAKVFAYDIDEKGRKLCYEMAVLNNTSNRVYVREFCSAEELRSFKFTDRGLIISDCEGFERSLFNQTNLNNLRNCDLIIETHDFIKIDISTYLERLFSTTHHVTIIKSIDDIEKAKTYVFPEIEGLSLDEKKELLAERRPAIMEWLYCTPK